MSRPMTDPNDLRHGTENGYVNLRCRCTACRAAFAAAQRVYRERRAVMLAAGLIEARHGTESTYKNYLCRCPECRFAKSKADAARRRVVRGTIR
mgnify:CR=1 FL=1